MCVGVRRRAGVKRRKGEREEKNFGLERASLL